MTQLEPHRAARWTVRALFVVPMLGFAVFVVWAVVLSAGALAHTLGVIAVVLLLGCAGTAMRR